MDRDELNELIAKGPVRILMNDGNEYTVESSEFITVSDIAAAVLYRNEEDGSIAICICRWLPWLVLSQFLRIYERRDRTQR